MSSKHRPNDQRFQLRMPSDLHIRVKVMAAKCSTSATVLINLAIEEFLKKPVDELRGLHEGSAK